MNTHIILKNSIGLPNSLFKLACERYYEIYEINGQPLQLLSSLQRDKLLEVLGLSDFVFTQLLRYPQWITDIFESSYLDNQQLELMMPQRLTALIDDCVEEARFDQAIRQCRNYFQLVIAWRDLCHLGEVKDSLRHIATLAELLIIATRDWHYQQLANTWGVPCDEHGEQQPLLILGMGKLGGRELNFSSDIDLIFTFPEHGQTQGGRRSTDNQQFFVKLAQKLINSLDKYSFEGFVYRVDMRLRPFGNSGPLVVSFNALEDYYQSQGREWERYAMVKARVLGLDGDFSAQLSQLLRPFVFRRYIDFSAIESLRQMKQLISHEVRRRGLVDNIKLGAGGIREVEFIIQVFQMIRGGREPLLRQQSLLATLKHFETLAIFPADICHSLAESYLYLRQVEHYLQQFNDQQTQTLPDNPQDWQRLIYLMNNDDEDDFRVTLNRHLSFITSQFYAVIGEDESENEQENKELNLLKLVFESDADFDGESILFELDCRDPQPLFEQLQLIKIDLAKRSMGPRGREVLSRLMPKILLAIIARPQAGILLARLGGLLSKIATRTAYIELLEENPGALTQLIKLCDASSWISDKLTHFPMLLDELLDPELLYNPTSLLEYEAELHQYLLRIPVDDMEQMMEAVRQYKQSQQLRIAAADITGVLPLMAVSDHLTALAQAIVKQTIEMAWQQMVARYGQPVHLGEDKGFAAIGYGKLGGMELGYSSDLDMVFVHCAKPNTVTDGDKSIASNHFYLKLAQRILHLFITRTNTGILYEADMRLRPSGNSGLMVSDIETFIEYQYQEAWIWEHQALIRARVVVGDQYLSHKFDAARFNIITQTRDLSSLQQEVVKMREKMREHLGSKNLTQFDLKQDTGGIADIEFLAQYLVLGYAQQYPALAKISDNVRIFETLSSCGMLDDDTAAALNDAYCCYRDKGHRLALQQQKNTVASDEFHQEKQLVTKQWRYWLLSPPSGV
ncbi:MAG: bifunctional [glutamate--ammonia ligase]-adenylyl-L-tyrosine phosphorylase/[glutamate--ammonia-ligase] adenylyltransferase [Gammaproteobacteria bacterium]|nr:bifunctional [glutamate--ammonia ligase]-adenylyl-L-tyrosine phosphorylase/[glutamate--ammonia-ligase] adenylyltransferase [Gammaproteobacteria bacterium]